MIPLMKAQHTGEMRDEMEDTKKEAFKKKWENFWYYHKLHTAVGIFVILVVLVFVRDKMKQIEYDYTVAVVTSEGIPQKDMDELQTVLEKMGTDRNGDKKVHVLLQNYAIGDKNGESSNPQITMANQQKFIVDVQTGTSMILIYTDEVYEMYKEQGIFYTKGDTPGKLKDCAGYEELEDSVFLEELNLSMRNPDESLWKKDQEVKSYYEDSEKLLERFTHGDK